MANDTADKRVTKTRRSLVYAMLALLERRGFQHITVNDICEEALVGRSTFYAHYEDKYALMRACLEEISVRLRKKSESADPIKRLGQALGAIRDNARVFRNVFDASDNRELHDLFQTYFMGLFTGLFDSRLSHESSLPAELYAAYSAAGITGTVLWWIGHEYPIDERALAEFHFARLRELGAACGAKFE